MTRSRIWTLGAIALIVAIVAGGWFLLVSPTRAEAADVQAQTASQQAANAQLTSTIEQLKVMAQDLPAQEAKIAEFRQKIPTSPGLPSFIRDLSKIAKESHVVLVSMEPSAPAALTVTAPATVTPDPATSDATADDTGSVTLTQTTTSAVQYVPAKVTVRGGYFNTEQFFTKLEKLQRAFLATGFDMTTDDDANAQAGDVVTNLQVRVFFAKSLTATSSGTSTATPTSPAN